MKRLPRMRLERTDSSYVIVNAVQPSERKHAMRMLLPLLTLLAACGDPRESFVGSYTGKDTTTLTMSDGTKSTSTTPNISVTVLKAFEDDTISITVSALAEMVSFIKWEHTNKCLARNILIG